MAEISREELWDLIKQFVNASAWKNNGYVTKVMTSYRSIHLSGSYRGYTAWLCFIYPGQEIKNGIYISVYINRTKNGRFFNISNVEICYATSECVKAKLQWNKDAYPTSISFTYPQSRCAATYNQPDILSDACKEEFLNTLDIMIDEYKEIFEKKYVSGLITSDKPTGQKSLDWVEEKLGKKLTDEQKKVVELDYEKENIDAALVVASAGCGKSTTLLGHTLDLIAEGKIKDSNDVLLVVFNKKNRKELQEKVESFGFEHLGASIHTFHSLGLSIVQEKNPQINSIDPDSEQNPFNKVLKQYTDIKVKKGGDEWIQNLWRFGTDFAKKQDYEDIYQNEIIDEELRKKVCLLESAGFSIVSESKEDDLIKLRLQNFLTLRGIQYKMQSLQNVKCFICSGQKILATICWPPQKQNQADIFLENFNADTFKMLEGKLEALGINFQNIDDSELKRYINSAVLKARGLIFQKTAQFFITVFKIKYPNGSTADLQNIQEDLLNKHVVTLEQNHINAFFNLLLPIYDDYQQELEKTCQIDFNDMLNQAIDFITTGTVKRNYKYILVDEFQDVAEDNFKLIKALQEKTGARVMCVGDDWQSIYAWRGSDLEYFENFNKYFPNSKELYINQTFRNGPNLVKIASDFIRKDKYLKNKLPTSQQPETELIPIYYNSSNKQQKWNELINHIKQNYPQKEVLFLGRYNYDCKSFGKQIDEKKYMTMHKSKGLEKDVIVLINLTNTPPYSFPSQVKGDIVFDTLYKDREEKAKAEERRLFYVALTRARSACYLWIPEKNTSDFITEIMPQL